MRTFLVVILCVMTWAQQNVIDPTQFGLDCSGRTDNTAVWNRLVAATGDNTTFFLPNGCIDAHSYVAVSSRAGFKLVSGVRAQNGGGTNPPTELWIGGSGGMWDFQACQAPTVEGFLFTNLSTAHLDYFLRFDGNPAARIGTEEEVAYNTFTNNQVNPGNFDAISVNTISGQNHEKGYWHDNDFFCSQSAPVRESDSGQIVSGSHTLTCGLTNCSFMTDVNVGDRVRVSYASGILDTTVASKTDDNHLQMTDAAISTQTNARIHFKTAYGNGLTIGSINAKHHQIDRNSFTQCDHGLNVLNGSFSASILTGSSNNTLVYVGNIVEPSELGYLADENSLRDLYVRTGDAPLTVSHARNSIYNAESDGFLYFVNGVRVTLSASTLQSTPPANAVLIRAGSPSTVILLALGNVWSPGQVNQNTLGYSQWNGVTSPEGALITCGDFGMTDANGNWTLPITCGVWNH
jgi:hypothetical protein